jgi:hypothetical protein
MAGPPSDSLAAIMAENPFTKTRQTLLGELESLLAAKLEVPTLAATAYVSNTINPAATLLSPMNFSHEKPLFDVLRECRTRSENLALILHTMGGDAQFPARAVRLIRKDLSFSKFFVVVPQFAKSAGTLITLASDGSITGPLTQFGPIDPQLPRVTKESQSWVSARAVRDTYRKLIEETIPSVPSGAQVGIASSIDWLLRQQALDAIQSTEELVRSIQANYQPNLKVDDILGKLVDTSLAHGKDVSPAQLREYGFPVTDLGMNDPIWAKLSEYLTRALRNLAFEQPPGGMGIVLFETRSLSMVMSGQAAPQGRAGASTAP